MTEKYNLCDWVNSRLCKQINDAAWGPEFSRKEKSDFMTDLKEKPCKNFTKTFAHVLCTEIESSGYNLKKVLTLELVIWRDFLSTSSVKFQFTINTCTLKYCKTNQILLMI